MANAKGLLWLEQIKEAQPEQQGRRKRGSSKAPALPADRSKLSCSSCTLDKETLRHPKMPPTGSANPIFYILGEAPGKNEDEQGEQFIGKSGDLIRKRWPEEYVDHTRWNNTVRCRPPGNRDPSPLELACCRHFQVEDIERTKPAIIVAFGAIALQWLTPYVRDPAFAGGRQHGEAKERGIPAVTSWRGRRLPVKVGSHTCWAYVLNHPAWLVRAMNDRRLGDAHVCTFERDLGQMFSDYRAGLPEPYVEPPEEFRKNIEVLTEFGPKGLARIRERLQEIAQRQDSAIDVETNGLKPYFVHKPMLLSVAVGNYDDTFAFGIDHPECQWTTAERDEILKLLHCYLIESGRKWAHFLKMELTWLRAVLEDDHLMYQTEWGDTHAQAHTIDERPAKELEDLTTLHLGFDVKAVSNIDAARLSEYPLHDVLMYNGMDTKYTDAIRVIQQEIIEREGLQQTYHNFVRLTPSLVRMQSKGVVRDVEEIKKLHAALGEKENKIKRKIMENKDVQRFRHVRAGFSPTSNPQLLEFFADFLKFKITNVDEEALGTVRHPVADMVLELRSEGKLRSTYVTPLLDGGKHVALDGKVHPNIGHTFTVTTRTNSSEPNIQNFPRRERKEIRRVIGVPPGHKFGAFDFGQLESRVVAMTSKDKTLVAETRRGDDIHMVWTEKIGGHFLPKRLATKEGRDQIRDGIKNLWTFPNFFGSELFSMAQDLSNRFEIEISEDALRPFYDEFWDKYPEVLAWQDWLVDRYWETGYAETLTGFRRHEPMNRNEIINIPVQGTAAQIVLDAQYRIDRKSYEEERETLRSIMNVHDDLSFYLWLLSMEKDIEDIAREMCCCSFDWINVPLAVEVSIGDNWADKDKLHTFLTTDFQ